MRRTVRDVVGGKQGGKGGKKPASKKAPTGQLPSEAFKNLLKAVNQICVTVGDVLCADDDMSREACHEKGQEFESQIDQRLTGQKRLQILEEMEDTIAEFMMGLVFQKEAQEKANVYQLVENLHDALYACIKESLENVGEDEAETSTQIQAEKEAVALIKNLGALLVTTAAQKAQYKPVFRKHYTELLQESLKIGQSSVRSNDMREQALNLSSGLVTVDAAAVVEFNLIDTIVDSCFKLCADPSDEGLDPSGFSSQNLGTQHLDGLAFTVKPNTVVAEAVYKKALELLASQDRYEKKAALVCLAVLPEACQDFCSQADHLTSMIQPAIASASDSDELIKSAAFICLAEFIQHTQPQVQSYHDQILPHVITALESSEESTMVKAKAVIPLSQLCLQLSAKDMNIITTILPSIVKIIKSTRTKLFKLKDDIELMESLINCIRSLAMASGVGKLNDSLNEVIEMMLEIVKDNEDMYEDVKVSATACLGDLIKALGKEQAKSHFETIMAQINESVQDNNVALRGACHSVFADLVSTLTTDVVPQLSTYINSLTRCLAIDYKGKAGASKKSGDEDDEEEDDEEDEEEEDEEDMDDEDFDEDMEQGEENPITDERRWALHAIKICIETYKTEFLPYHEKIFNMLFEHSRDYEDEVQGYIANMISSFPQMFPQEQKPVAGASLELDQPTKNLFQSVMIMLNHFVEKCADDEVVAVSLDAMASITKHFGQVVLLDDNKSLDNIVANSKKLLQGQLFCQLSEEEQEEIFMKEQHALQGDEDEEGEDEEDDEDDEEDEDDHHHGCGKKCGHKHDEDEGEHEEDEEDDGKDPVIQSGLELLQTVAKARGAAFEPVLAEVYDLMIKTTEDETQEAYAYGVLAEMLEPLGSVFTPYIPKLFASVFETLKSWKDNVGVAHNSAFCLGVLALKGGETAAPFYGQTYEALKTLLSQVKVEGAKDVELVLACRDNIISSLGKLLTVASSHADVPKDEAVTLFLSGLPVTRDMEEAVHSYTFLSNLVASAPEQHQTILNIYKQALTSSTAAAFTDSLKAIVVQGAESLKQHLSDSDKEALSSLL